MSRSMIAKISSIISKNSDIKEISLHDIEYACDGIVTILKKEEVRKLHISKEIKIEEKNEILLEKLSNISFLEEHLKKTEENIKNLQNYLEILSSKRLLLELQSNIEIKMEDTIDLKKSFLYN